MKTRNEKILSLLLCVSLVCIIYLSFEISDAHFEVRVQSKKLADISAKMKETENAITKERIAISERNPILSSVKSESKGEGSDQVLIARSKKAAATAAVDMHFRVRVDPDLQQLYLKRFQAMLGSTLPSLYHRFNLSEEVIKRFEGILSDRFLAAGDLSAAAVARNVPPTDPDFRRALELTINPPDDPLISIIGQDAFDAFSHLKRSYKEAGLVDSLVAKTAFSSPLTVEQTNQVAEILTSHNVNPFPRGDWLSSNLFPIIGPQGFSWTDIDLEAAAPQLQSILSSSQYKTLVQLHDESMIRKQSDEIYNRKIRELTKNQTTVTDKK